MGWDRDVNRLNRENDEVDGPGAVVLREFTSWLASVMTTGGKDGWKTGDPCVAKGPHEAGTLKYYRWMIDIWRNHAESYRAADAGEIEGLVPINSYCFGTSLFYRKAVCAAMDVDLVETSKDSHGSAFGGPVKDLLLLQRWREMQKGEQWADYQQLVRESEDCWRTNRDLFKVDFVSEILG
jgi:hypothetical protein